MKTRLLFPAMLILLLTAALFLPSSPAQDYTRWHLPEGAVARFGKGLLRDLVYFPDGNRLAALSSIGIWIYDVRTGEELDLLTDLGTAQMWNIMELSPDGRTLAAATDIKSFYGIYKPINSINFSWATRIESIHWRSVQQAKHLSVGVETLQFDSGMSTPVNC